MNINMHRVTARLDMVEPDDVRVIVASVPRTAATVACHTLARTTARRRAAGAVVFQAPAQRPDEGATAPSADAAADASTTIASAATQGLIPRTITPVRTMYRRTQSSCCRLRC